MSERENEKVKFADQNDAIKAIDSNFSLLNSLFVFCFAIFSSIVLAKIFGSGEFVLLGISIPTVFALLLLLCCTVVHAFITSTLLHYLFSAREILEPNRRRKFYASQVSSGYLITRGVRSYEDSIAQSESSGDLILTLRTDFQDISISLQYILALVVVCATVPWRFEAESLVFVVFSFALLKLNWSIGANWMLAFADFSAKENESVYFESGDGPRNLIAVSGPWVSTNTKWGRFLIASFLGYFVYAAAIVVFFWMSFNFFASLFG